MARSRKLSKFASSLRNATGAPKSSRQKVENPTVLSICTAYTLTCEWVHEFKIAVADYFSNEFCDGDENFLFLSRAEEEIRPIDEISPLE